MKALTQEERQALIDYTRWKVERISSAIKQTAFGTVRSHLEFELSIAKIALASLEDKPSGKWVVQHTPTEQGYDRYSFASWDVEPENGAQLFTRPPVVVSIKLPKVQYIGDNPDSYFNQRVFDAEEVEQALKAANVEVKS